MPLAHALTGRTIALVAIMAAFLAASTIWGGYPLTSGVPITLQTFAVLLAGAVLGAYRGAAAVILYLIAGTAGAPIFSGHTGGLSAWQGPTAGFLVSFVIAAFVVGWIFERQAARGPIAFSGALGATSVGAFAVITVLGWLYIALKYGGSLNDTVVSASAFLPGDLIKAFLAAAVAVAVHRAYPGLLAQESAPAAAPAPAASKPRATAKSS